MIGVYGTIDEVYGCYYEEMDGIQVASKSYVMKAGEKCYIGICIKDNFEQMERLVALSMGRLKGEKNEAELESAKFQISGVIRKIYGSEEFYYSAFEDEYQLANGQKHLYLGYYIDVIDWKQDIIAPFLVIFIVITLALWVVYRIVFGGVQEGYQKLHCKKKFLRVCEGDCK